MNIADPKIQRIHHMGILRVIGGHRSAEVWLRQSWGQGSHITVELYLCIFFTYVQLLQIFTPWDQCWNCVHLSSLHTQLELTLASFFAAGLWVSPTETLRPVRWLLSFSFSSSFSLPLFPCVLSNRVSSLSNSPLFYSSLLFFFSYFLFIPPPPALLLSPVLSHSSTFFHWLQTDSTVKGKQQSWWSANFMSFPWRLAACARLCVRGTLLDTGQQSHLLSCHSLWPKKPWVRSSR